MSRIERPENTLKTITDEDLRNQPSPRAEVWSKTGPETSAVTIVLHGGQKHSRRSPHRVRGTYLRMLPFVTGLRDAGREHDLAVWLLRYRYRGWNAPAKDPVKDAEWAIERAQQRHPGVPIVLVGHSMGGRAALRVAGHPAVTAVCALAPWVEDGEPFEHLAGRSVLIAHGNRDRITDPSQSYRFAVEAKSVTEQACRFDVRGEGHGMLRRASEWHNLTTRFVLGALKLAPEAPEIAAAMSAPSPDGLRVVLHAGT